MRFKNLIAAAAVVLGLGATTQAQAAPQLLLPDLTFSARSDGRINGGEGLSPVNFNLSGFSLDVRSSYGDAVLLNTGSGYVSTDAILLSFTGPGVENTLGGITYSGTTTIEIGPGIMVAAGAQLVLERTMVGFNGLAFLTVNTVAAGSPWTVGQKLALDLHIYNVTLDPNGMFHGDVKGDLAPVIPEPATLSLVGLGLAGFAARARRKLVG